MDEAFEHYMVAKKHAESELGLTDLDRIILRASALTNESGKGRADFGLAKVHKETSRMTWPPRSWNCCGGPRPTAPSWKLQPEPFRLAMPSQP